MNSYLSKQVQQQQRNQLLHLPFNLLKKASLDFLIARVDEYLQQISNIPNLNPYKITRNIMHQMIQKILFFFSNLERLSKSFQSIQREIQRSIHIKDKKLDWQNRLENIRQQQENLSDQFSIVFMHFTKFINFSFVQGRYQIHGQIDSNLEKLKDQIKQQICLYFGRMISQPKKQQYAAEMRIKIQIKLKLKKIGKDVKQILKESLKRKKNKGFIFDSNQAKFLLQKIQVQFDMLFSIIIKIIKSQYSNRRALQNKINMKQSIKQQIKLEYYTEKIIQYFQNGYKNLQNDCLLNLQKMFSQIVLSRGKKIEVEEICHQLKIFPFQFRFIDVQSYFIKTYKRWWKGRLQQQTRLMYEKHLLFIKYLILTKPKTIVQYFQVKQTPQRKQFTFLMQKGHHSFINFEEGKKFFKQLSIIQKVKAILNMLQCIIQLQEHGISHNDITIRNFVVFGEDFQKQKQIQRKENLIRGKANIKFKLIDFDVARMVDIPFSYSSYPLELQREIYQTRCKLIEISSKLLRKQLKQQHYTSKTDKLKDTTPVQNINRLAQYIMLSNKNELLQILLNENNIRDKKKLLDKQNTLKIVNEYQKLIIGKRDCNKFGLLLLKLMLNSDKKLSPYQLEFIEKFVSQSKKGSLAINYKKYLSKINLFSKQYSEEIDENTLRLISQMFVAKLHKRISAKVTFIKLFDIFKIHSYPISFDNSKIQLYMRSIEEGQFINLRKILNFEEKQWKKKPLSLIDQLFLQTNNTNRQSNKMWYEYLLKITPSVLPQIQMNIIQKHEKKKPTQQERKDMKNKIKIPQFISCQVHKLPAQYKCLEDNSKEHLLCIQCMMNMNKTRELFKIKKIHKILHIHDEKINFAHQIICFVVKQNGKKQYLCSECLQQIQKFQEYNEIYCISKEDYSVYDYYYNSVRQLLKPELSMMSLNNGKINGDEYSKVDFENMFKKIQSVKVNQNEIYKALFLSRKYMNEIIQNLANHQKQNLKNFRFNKSITKIERIIEYIKTKQTILKLRHKNEAKFLQHIKLLHQLIQINKSKISQQNLYNICEYYLQQIKATVNKQKIKLMQTQRTNKRMRSFYLITSRQIFLDCDKIFKKGQTQSIQIEKIVPSARELAKRKQRQIKKRQLQLQSNFKKNVDSNNSSLSSSISIDNSWKNGSTVDNRLYNFCYKCFQELKSKNYSIGFCINKQCFNQPFCHDCEKFHDEHIQYTIKFSQNQSKQSDKILQYFEKNLRELRKANPIQKSITMMFNQIRQQIQSLFQIINTLCERGCYSIGQQFKKTIFPQLKKAILNNNLPYYSDILWIAQNFTGDPIRFMNVFSLAMKRYCFVASQVLPKQLCREDQLERQKQGEGLRQLEYISNRRISQFLGNKYRVISNVSGINTPCNYSEIPHRHFPLVERLILHDIQINYEDGHYKQQQNRQLQKKQMVKRLMRDNTSDFDIQLYRFYLNPLPSNFLGIISNLIKLKHLQIVKQYNASDIFVLKSLQMQAILCKCSQLQSITIKCVNTLDSYCWKLIEQQHTKCRINIYSYSGEVLQKRWVQTLFNRATQIVNPYEYEGEAILQPYENMQNIESANYKILCDDNNFEVTKNFLERNNRVKNAHRLQIVYNQLSGKYQKNTVKNLSVIKKYYWCRKTYGLAQQRIQRLSKQINKGHQKIQTINKLIFCRYTNITHLTLQGLLFNGEYDPTAEMAQKLLIDYFSGIKTLQTLQLNKCFGIKLDYITENRFNLKRLVINQCVFKLNAGGIRNRQIQMNKLQTLILNRVGLISIDNQKKLLSFQLSTIFNKFIIPNVKTIIINNFYQMEDEELNFIQNCLRLQKLSIKRCFKITSQIMWKIYTLQNLKHFDFTQTEISSSLMRQFFSVQGREIKLYHNEDIKQLPIGSIKVLKQISRMVNVYHIDSFQNTKVEPVLSNNDKMLSILNAIDEISLCDVKIRENSQYHIFDIFKLPEIQIIKIEDCQWKNHKKHSSISFNNFPIINSLLKIKELSLHKCQIRKIKDTQIEVYNYLRKLSLQQNYYLTEFPSMRLTELRYLSLYRTSIAHLDINKDHMPNLKFINIQNTEITQLPPCFFLLERLSLVKYQYSDSKVIRQNNAAINLLNKSQIQSRINATSDQHTLLKWIKSVVLDSFIVFSQFQYHNFEQDVRLYIEYLLFTIEADVKGRPQYLWYQQFLQKRKQQTIEYYKQQIKYETTKIKSMILKGNKEYQLWNIVDIQNNTKTTKQIAKILQAFTYKNILHIKSLDIPYFVKIYDIIRQFTDKTDSNYIVQFEAVKKFRSSEQLKSFIKKNNLKDRFSKFLQNSFNFLQENIYYTNFTYSGIGYSQQDRIFKLISFKNIINLREGQNKQILQIFRYLVLSYWDNYLLCDYLRNILCPKMDMKKQTKQGKIITLHNNRINNIFEFSSSIPQEFSRSKREKCELFNQLYVFNQKTVDQIVRIRMQQLKQCLQMAQKIQRKRLQQLIGQKQQTGKQNEGLAVENYKNN